MSAKLVNLHMTGNTQIFKQQKKEGHDEQLYKTPEILICCMAVIMVIWNARHPSLLFKTGTYKPVHVEVIIDYRGVVYIQ